ncbi:hypothetical protein C8F01DRAFT_1104072 [Mycena amicta]|nr:hypothetical protein C8F01DRAFT_1104072 [Mycena amicta]
MACFLPQRLLDDIVSRAMDLEPSLRLVFLASLGSQMHSAATRILFHSVSLADSHISSESERTRTVLHPLLTNPVRYAPNVRRVCITDAAIDDGSACVPPIEAETLNFLFEMCPNVEELVWQSTLPPPDGVCETLATYNPRLSRISFTQPPFSPRNLKWDAPSLPLLAVVPLTSIRVSRLSQAGARAFCQLLEALGVSSSLECLYIDFVWLDDPLCERIAAAGKKKLRHLTLSTKGTKLSDRGIVTILEECEALEELVLDEVQGRLSKGLWNKPTSFPATLETIRIVISEPGLHHSWALDHLESIHAILATSICALDIIRREALPSMHCGAPVYDGTVDDIAALKPVPVAFMDKIKEKSQLTAFRCDFWSFTHTELKQILECLPKLEHLLLCIDSPFSRLVSLTSNLSNLRTLAVSFLLEHAPGKPPTPIVPDDSQTSLPTPSDSPVLKSKAVLPQLLDLDQMQTHDPSMPLLRDIKRFVRKCPRLELLDWCGKNGRGSWAISRAATTTSKSMNLSVEYLPPKIDDGVWNAVKREKSIEDAMKRGWGGFAEIERPGSNWTGATAELFAAQRLAAEKEKAEATSPTERVKPRESTKRTRVPSVTISTNSTSPLSPTASPIRQHVPLTPPLSDRDCSSEDAVSPLSRMRSPSEPSGRARTQTRPRTQSATANGKESTGQHSSGRGGKQPRGRGGSNSTRGSSKKAAATTSASKASSGRDGRGGRAGRASNDAQRRQPA